MEWMEELTGTSVELGHQLDLWDRFEQSIKSEFTKYVKVNNYPMQSQCVKES